MVKKVDKGRGEEETLVSDYLARQNRPYSANDIFNNLHGKVAKASLARVLTALSASGEISCKTYAKSQIYVAKQEAAELPSQAEMDKMDAEHETLKLELQELEQKSKELQGQLGGLRSSLTDAALKERLKTLAVENQRRAERLAVLREGGVLISEKDLKKINTDFDKNKKLWRDRKRRCLDIMGMILEGLPMKKKDFMEEVGLETDEDVGADPKDAQ